MNRTLTIVMAEDDPSDRLLVQDALAEAEVNNELRWVEDGEALCDYLQRRGAYGDKAQAPRPDLILLDLNMPRKDGREVLKEIKADPQLRRIPVVVLTTSQRQEDILGCYDAGVGGYVTKPASFTELVETMRRIGQYWFDTVALPQS